MYVVWSRCATGLKRIICTCKARDFVCLIFFQPTSRNPKMFTSDVHFSPYYFPILMQKRLLNTVLVCTHPYVNENGIKTTNWHKRIDRYPSQAISYVLLIKGH